MTGTRAGMAVLLLCLACACTTDEPSTSAGAERRATPTSSDPSGPPTSPPTTTTPAPTGRREPLVLAVDVHRPELHLTTAQAKRIIAGKVSRWSQVGQPGGPLTVLTGAAALGHASSDAGAVAVVPASSVTPFVQVATVGDVDPLVHPDRYPITVESQADAPKVTTLTIVGDIMLGRGVGAATPNDPGAALQPMSRRLANADLTIGNLESTLSDDGVPQQPGDDSFAADPRVLGSLADAGFDALSLANNHTGDFGVRALRQTLQRFDGSGIARVGAGVDARDAWRPVVLEHAGVRFGFVAFNAIGETPRATATSPGAAEVRMQPRTGPLNPNDLRRVTRTVSRLDRRVDVVVVLPHWGTQYTNQPVADQRSVGSALIDAGADIVVGGHPHWVQGIEVHDGRLIVNSLGNFIFDMDFRRTQQGVMLQLVCWDDTVMSARLTPYVIRPDFAPRTTSGSEAARILDQIWHTSDPPFATSQ
jgi:poly-gamma-glutamate capsule biosynthesis protein CapA/YwtB (metallophosphatase superfamily)